MSFRQPGRARIAVVVALVVAVGLVAVTGLALISTGSDRSLTLTFYRPSPADGSIPDGEEPSVFDQESPAVNRLDPDLLTALRASASEAHRDGVDVVVNSGWRSRKFQQWLLDRATDRYGSRAEPAAGWTPQWFRARAGKAVDIGPVDAAAWFAANGSRDDLCQIYANESWHYELRPGASIHGCPDMYADAAHDPRSQN